ACRPPSPRRPRLPSARAAPSCARLVEPLELGEVLGELGWQRRRERAPVGQLDLLGVEPEPLREAGDRAKARRRVAGVAHDAVADALQVAPELVAAAGGGPHLEVAGGAEPGDEPVPGHRLERLAPPRVAERRADDPLAMGSSVHERPVALDREPLAKNAAELG